jgi:uncharacterized membrane protein AbrB (regulator of aidB expression)
MWLNFIFLILASLCVGFILGWIVARPRRWGAFGADLSEAGQDQSGADTFARRA